MSSPRVVGGESESDPTLGSDAAAAAVVQTGAPPADALQSKENGKECKGRCPLRQNMTPTLLLSGVVLLVTGIAVVVTKKMRESKA